MSLFKSLDQDACEAIVGGNLYEEGNPVYTRNPSSSYLGTNYGQFKNEYTNSGVPANPSAWYPIGGKNYGQSVKAAN
jgi:hypothetical protein